ncbi:MAG: cupin-like domain-containing protein [Planctomycetota bacterium]
MNRVSQADPIPEVGASELASFLSNYYRPEQPVIFRGIVKTERSVEQIRELLCDRIAKDDTKTARLMWFDVKPDLLQDLCDVPEAVSTTLDPETAFLRDNCVRVWFNPAGHMTPWHYDGHSLHVFNLQLKGKKRWTIVSPDTPLLNMPFSKTCIFENNAVDNKRHYEFDLDEGDMVFLPRYWYHHVESLGDMNVNVNWVLMPKAEPADTVIARREAEVLWLMQKLYPVLPSGNKWMLDHFAGAGKPALGTLTDEVSFGRGVARVVKEAVRFPLVALAIPTQIKKARTVLASKKLLRGLVPATS